MEEKVTAMADAVDTVAVPRTLAAITLQLLFVMPSVGAGAVEAVEEVPPPAQAAGAGAALVTLHVPMCILQQAVPSYIILEEEARNKTLSIQHPRGPMVSREAKRS